MSDIEFTHEELAEELLAMQGQIASGDVNPLLIGDFVFAVSQFDETVSSEVSEGIIDEEQAIEFEDFRRGLADAVYEAVKDKIGKTRQLNLLNHHKDTPRADAKRKAEEDARDAERKTNTDRVLGEIKTYEAKHAVTSQMLRNSKYKDPTEKPQERKGTWLAHKIEEIEDNGSEIAVFTAQEAKLLAGNALIKKSHADVIQLKHDLEKLAKLHEQAKSLGAHVEPGLFSGVSKLKELAETSLFEKRLDLREIRRFIELLESPAEDIFEKVVTALDEGPFANCPELEVIPFPPESELHGKRSLKEIPNEDANEENILDDINKAVKASGGTEYIVEDERVSEFVGLKEHYEEKYPGRVKIYRSLKSNWHPLPWYIIEIAQPADPPAAILESPLYGNATYFINNGDWQGTINFKRTEARKLGAKPIIHSVAAGQSLAMHTSKIKATVKKALGE